MSSENNKSAMGQIKDKANNLASNTKDGINNVKDKTKEIINDVGQKIDNKR